MKISLAVGLVMLCIAAAWAAEQNLVNAGAAVPGGAMPAGYELTGGASFHTLGDARRDFVRNGVALSSNKPSGEVSCIVTGLDASKGRWFRLSFRGLPQGNFAVGDDDLYMKVAFFGSGGKISYDAKEKKIYDQIETARRDLTVNGVRHQRGAEVWRTYTLDFYLPFPQVDQLKLSVGFGHGAATRSTDADFFVNDISLVKIPDPPGGTMATTKPTAIDPQTTLLPIGGRWFYLPKTGETSAPKKFDSSNVDRLLYHDAAYSAPFAGNTTAWLRAGEKDLSGNVLTQDRLIADNVTVSFDETSMIIHTHGVPNHPTGRFPEQGFGNPSYIGEQDETFYFPLNPKPNPKPIATTNNNSNHALHMGPIGLAVNGVVFFNPFDMGNTDATDLMDRCCGHPNQDNQYHYHKYPICVNSPWDDDGKEHSPLLGWAFDGVPVYGPYEIAGVMAKDVKGEHALNDLNAHYDEARGWHYHVTPGKFPYLIGGFYGVEDSRDHHPPRGGMGGQGGPGGGPGGDNRRGPGNGPPPGRDGRGRPPFGPPPPPQD